MINFDKIVDDIFIGTCPMTSLDIQRVKQAGITAVLNLQTDLDFVNNSIRWPVLEEEYHNNGIAVYRIQIIDFDDEDLIQNLPIAAKTLNDMIENNHTAYVHCTAGMQRSPSTVIGFLAWHRSNSLEKASEIVLGARNCAPPIHVLAAVDKLVSRFESGS